MRSQLRQQQQQQQLLHQQQLQLLQHQWVRTDPNGNMEDDDYDDDVDDDAEDKDVDEVFGTPLLPPTPRPAAKKFESAATVATAASGKRKKKISPSIIKKYSSNWSELGATTAAAGCRQKKAVRWR